jgi:hypothetical protein
MENLNIISILKNHKSESGITLYQHICLLLNKLINEPGDLKEYENFEILSELIKKNHFIYSNPKPDFEVNDI